MRLSKQLSTFQKGALGMQNLREKRVFPDANLTRILLLADKVVPGLCGQQEMQICRFSSSSNEKEASITAMLDALRHYWKKFSPEAGPHYVALRCWRLAIWQPIYPSLIATHLDSYVPKLDGLVQPIVEGFPQGFRLPVHAPVAGCLSSRIDRAAREIHRFCTSLREILMPMVGLHLRAADQVQAECVFGALLCIRLHNKSVLNDADVIEIGRDWLALLGINDGCYFFTYRTRDGDTAFALDRKVCCHHFRRHDCEKCSTCPKLSTDARIARLLAGSF